MTTMTTVKVGTRGSILALAQTQLVTDALIGHVPHLRIENHIIKTEGDRNESPIPLDTVGKAWFTSEIDQALLSHRIDLAVHSLKDLPLELADGLDLIITLKRAHPGDVLVTKSAKSLADLPSGSVIGTDSIRRRSLILHARPDLQVRSLRGNVQTRLRKLHNDDYDGIILAAAGLERLGKLDLAAEVLDPTRFIPAVGQGTLAVEIRHSDTELRNHLRALEDEDTKLTAAAERAFSAAVGAGCKLPVGCYASVDGASVTLYAMIGELDGPGLVIQEKRGARDQAVGLAASLGQEMVSQCPFAFKPADAKS